MDLSYYESGTVLNQGQRGFNIQINLKKKKKMRYQQYRAWQDYTGWQKVITFGSIRLKVKNEPDIKISCLTYPKETQLTENFYYQH
jgi:hypothetical protein